MTEDLAKELRDIKAMLAQLLAASGKPVTTETPIVFNNLLDESRYVRATGGDVIQFLRERNKQNTIDRRAAKRKGQRP